MLNIQNKVIAITGASSGIGEAAARFLAAKGAKVVLGARRIENLQTIAARIQAASGEVRRSNNSASIYSPPKRLPVPLPKLWSSPIT